MAGYTFVMSLPPESDSPSEYDSNRPLKLSKSTAVHFASFISKIGLAHTLQALDAIKRDFLRSDLQQNMQVKELVRAAANKQAQQIGFKGVHGNAHWWN